MVNDSVKGISSPGGNRPDVSRYRDISISLDIEISRYLEALVCSPRTANPRTTHVYPNRYRIHPNIGPKKHDFKNTFVRSRNIVNKCTGEVGSFQLPVQSSRFPVLSQLPVSVLMSLSHTQGVRHFQPCRYLMNSLLLPSLF